MKLIAGTFVAVFLGALTLAATQNIEPADWDKQMVAGQAAMKDGRYSEAERIYAAIVAGRRQEGGADARLGLSIGQLGMAKLGRGQNAGASAALQESVSILERAGPEYQNELATVLEGLGRASYLQRFYLRAEQAYTRAIDLRSKLPSPDLYSISGLLSNLGAVYCRQGRYTGALASLRQAEDLLDRSGHEDLLRRANLLNGIGAVWYASGRHAEAESAYRSALTAMEKSKDNDAELKVIILNNVAVEFMNRKAYIEAAATFARAVSEIDTGVQFPLPDVAQILQHYYRCLLKIGNRAGAKRLSERIKLIQRRIPLQPVESVYC